MAKSPFKIDSNFKIKANEISKYARRLRNDHLRGALFAALEEVGNVSAARYIKHTGNVEEAVSRPATGSRVTTRSARLVGSIVGTWRFGKAKLPVAVSKNMRAKIQSSGKGFAGGKRESIRKVKIQGQRYEGTIGSKVEYAALHEYGGKVSTPVTPQARRFFWFAYDETGDEKWKSMALSKKKTFVSTIPARPFLRPAMADARPTIHNIFKSAINATFAKARI